MGYIIICTVCLLLVMYAIGKTTQRRAAEAKERPLISEAQFSEFIKGAFGRMQKRHDSDSRIHLQFQPGALTDDGTSVLRGLLAADPLYLHRDAKTGIYNVFAGGYHVGTISPRQSEELGRMLQWSSITGCYLSQKHKDGSRDVIVFYHLNDASEALRREAFETCLS